MEAILEIAYNWHGGQSSAMYSFASCGGVVHSEEHRSDLIQEIENDLAYCSKEVGSTWQGKQMSKPEVFTQALADEYRPEIPKLQFLLNHVKQAKIGLKWDDAVEPFLTGYLTCALWSSNDESDDSGGEPMDRNYSLVDFAESAIAEAKADCAKFLAECKHDLSGRENEAGRDFWLNRNGHGGGFWDGDWDEPMGTELSNLSKTFGETDPYIGDDNKVYFS